MFRKSYNRAVLRIRIETVTPLLIRAGDVGLDPTAADLTCVVTRHARHGKTVYIPGSSLKGVIRSAAEARLRGQKLVIDGAGACDPLGEASCGKVVGQRKKNQGLPEPAVHKNHCMACRLFGSLAMKGRASIRDLFPWSEDHAGDHGPGGRNHQLANRLEPRHGVSIDRVVGSVRHGPFDQEMVPAGVSFWGDIALENYQIWQLGLLIQAFSEMNDGLAQLGSSKSRGLGVVTVEVESILHEQAGMDATRPAGVGPLATEAEQNEYGLLKEPTLPSMEGETRGFCTRFAVRDKASVDTWLSAGFAALGGLVR